MKEYYGLSVRCKYNRVMKIAEEIGQADWQVWEDACRARVTLSHPDPDPSLVRILRVSILLHGAWVKNEAWDRLLDGAL